MTIRSSLTPKRSAVASSAGQVQVQHASRRYGDVGTSTLGQFPRSQFADEGLKNKEKKNYSGVFGGKYRVFDRDVFPDES